MKARVFISCGQNKDTDEPAIAAAIARRLDELGYAPYIAVEESSLRGVKENIFARLSESEYFLFLDFKRESVQGGNGKFTRGSLFSHQELALASYMEKEAILFSEEGVTQDEGIMKFVQGNAIRFTDRSQLADMVGNEVRKRWHTGWRDELEIVRDEQQFEDGCRNSHTVVRHWHLTVRNNHRSKTAFNCQIYLEKVERLPERLALPVKNVESKWRGFGLPTAIIPPGRERDADSLEMAHSRPNVAIGRNFADHESFYLRLDTPGDYLLHFAVYSSNFEIARKMLHFSFDGRNVQNATLTQQNS